MQFLLHSVSSKQLCQVSDENWLYDQLQIDYVNAF